MPSLIFFSFALFLGAVASGLDPDIFNSESFNYEYESETTRQTNPPSILRQSPNPFDKAADFNQDTAASTTLKPRTTRMTRRTTKTIPRECLSEMALEIAYCLAIFDEISRQSTALWVEYMFTR